MSGSKVANLFDLALKHGKLSIAYMLFLKGCENLSSRNIQLLLDLEKYDYLDNERKGIVRRMLSPHALINMSRNAVYRGMVNFEPADIKAHCSRLGYKGADLHVYMAYHDIKEVQPFNVSIRSQSDGLMNQFYNIREHSQASFSKQMWIYK